MRRRLLALATAIVVPAASSGAQAWSYPAFQVPFTVNREFNFGVADASKAGTTLLVQWREAAGERSQFTLESGLIAQSGDNGNLLLLGGQYAFQLSRSSADVPLDLLFTAGAGLTVGDPFVLRVPLGLAVGHRFELEGGMFLTPFAHPRLSLDFCGDCDGDETSLGIDFDVGLDFEITSTIALRGAAFFGGGDLFSRNGFGISLAWRPPGLQR
jgi:hypothetical protein